MFSKMTHSSLGTDALLGRMKEENLSFLFFTIHICPSAHWFCTIVLYSNLLKSDRNILKYASLNVFFV